MNYFTCTVHMLKCIYDKFIKVLMILGEKKEILWMETFVAINKCNFRLFV